MNNPNDFHRTHAATVAKASLTATDRVTALAGALVRQHPKLTHDEAMQRVLVANPDLAAQCPHLVVKP